MWEATAPVEGSRPRRWALGAVWAVCALALLTSLLDVPARWERIAAAWQLTSLWGDPQAQHQTFAQGDLPHPYDLLREADRLLPPDASVLLATTGRDVERVEYITYHRALYLLAPRSVWWATPAPPDGTWKSRWRLQAELNGASLEQLAARVGATHILMYGDQVEPARAKVVASLPDGLILTMNEGETGPGARPDATWFADGWWPLRLAAAIAVIVAWGWALLVPARRWGLRVSPLEGVSLSWALGLGVVTWAMLLLGLAGMPLLAQVAVLTAGAVLANIAALGGLLGRLRPPRHRPIGEASASGSPHTPLLPLAMVVGVALAAWVALNLAMVGLEAVGRPLVIWDSWANWAVKARVLFLEGGITPSLYGDPSRAVTHLDYPLLVPLAQAWLFQWLGAPDDRLAGAILLISLLAMLGLVYSGLRRLGAGSLVSFAATTVVASASWLAGLAGSGFTEITLVMYLAGASLYLLAWVRGQGHGPLLVASLCAGLLPWCKREGAVLLAVLVLAMLVSYGVRRTWRAAACMLGAGVALAGPWWAFAAWQAVPNSAFDAPSFGLLSANAGRWPTILDNAWQNVTNHNFSYIWPLVLAAAPLVLLARRGRLARGWQFLPLASVLYLLLVASSYLFSAFVPYEQHVVSSIGRLVGVVTPLPLLWLVVEGAGEGRSTRGLVEDLAEE